MSFQARLPSARVFSSLEVCPRLPPPLIAETPAAEVGGGLCLIGSPSSAQTPGSDRAPVTCSPGQRPEAQRTSRFTPTTCEQTTVSLTLQNKNPLGALLHLNTAPSFLQERRLRPQGPPPTSGSPPRPPAPPGSPRPGPRRPPGDTAGGERAPPRPSPPQGRCRRSPLTAGGAGRRSSLAGRPRPSETPPLRPRPRPPFSRGAGTHVPSVMTAARSRFPSACAPQPDQPQPGDPRTRWEDARAANQRAVRVGPGRGRPAQWWSAKV